MEDTSFVYPSKNQKTLTFIFYTSTTIGNNFSDFDQKLVKLGEQVN